MNQENLMPSISTYKPLSDPKNDRLGFASFAEHIAKSIQNLPAEEGYVIGLYGEWGSGKTTVLNFVEFYLSQNDQNEENIILHFNPWLFSETQNLEIVFFDQLISLLRSNVDKFTRESIGRIVSIVSTISDIVSEVPIPGSKFPNKIVEYFPTLNAKDVTKIKKLADDLLKQSGNRIIIIIDDIDRLTKDEISRTFRLVKSIADFSNIVYIVSFDKEIVAKALSKDFDNGERYLEKIIQIPIGIPIINRRHIDKHISDFIGDLTKNLKDRSLFDETQWERIYSRWISPYFKNFRDVIRFVTLVKFEYSAVQNEVDVIDFLILYVLKLFEHEIYKLIRTNRYQFIPDIWTTLNDPDKSRFHNFHISSWYEKKKTKIESEQVKYLLQSLFPKLKELEQGTDIFNGFHGSNNRQCRISEEEYFYLYFGNELSDDQLTHHTYLEIIKSATNSHSLGEQLLSLKTDTQIYDFFDKVRYDKNLSNSQKTIIIETIFNIGDQIIKLENQGNYSITLNNIVLEYLNNIKGTEQRFSLVFNCLQQAKSTSLPILFLMELIKNRFRYDELFSDEHFQQLREHYDNRIQSLLADGEIFTVYDSGYIFVKWYELEPDLGQKFLEDDTNFVRFLGIFEPGRVVYRNDTKYFDFVFLKTIIEPESIVDRVKKLDKQDRWSNSESSALKQFLRDFDQGLHKR